MVAFDFDQNGNVKAITPPDRPAHRFTFTPANRLATYQLPDVGQGPATETPSYDADLRLTSVLRPDGKLVTFQYDTQKYRLQRIVSPRGNTDFGYHPATGQLTSITEPDGQGLAFDYDGPLVTKTTWTGEVSGSVERSYDSDLRLAELRVNGENPIQYRYDDDSRPIQVGDMTITRDPATGRELTTTLGNVTTERTYTAFGEPATYTAKFAGNEIYFEAYTYNKNGWIVDLERRVHGASTLYHYVYDLRGRLTEVWENGNLTSSYTYDANSNRLSYTGPLGNATATYDARDRLLTYGDATYTYTEAGELATKTENGLTTTYDYDVFGNLRRVDLPNGIVVEYLTDGAQRRIGEKINGVVVKTWLHMDQLRPLAELSDLGETSTIFAYGTRFNLPDFLIKEGKGFRILPDRLGSPRLVVDSETGLVAQELKFDEFGQKLYFHGENFQPMRFAGGMSSSGQGTIRFGRRDYEPHLGRWTTADPIRFLGKSSNLYTYVDQQPTLRTDVTGLWDLFLNIEMDFIGLIDDLSGIEAGVGVSLDFGNFRDSSIFASYGTGNGMNMGIGAGGGFCIREVNGLGSDLDINLGKISPQALFDDEGFNGLAASGGPGAGASYGTTNTVEITAGEAFDWVHQTLENLLGDVFAGADSAIESAVVGTPFP